MMHTQGPSLQSSMATEPIDVAISRWRTAALNDAAYGRWAADWSALELYLQDQHLDDTLQAAKRAYPQASQDWFAEVSWVFVPFVQKVAQTLAVEFDVAPSTYLVRRGDETPLPATDPNVIQWREDERRLRLPQVLKDLERRTTALRNQLVTAVWMRDHVEWRAYSPQDVRILQSESNPESLQDAPVVALRLHRPLATDGTRQSDHWLAYTLDEQTGQRGLWLLDADGRRIGAPVFQDGANPYGCTPAVLWQWDSPGRGQLWVPPPESLLATQRAANLGQTDMHYGLRYNAHPVPVLYGNALNAAGKAGPANGQAIGPARPLNFGDRQTEGLEFVRPGLNTVEHRVTIEALIQQAATMYGLPPDAFATISNLRNQSAMAEVKAELDRIRKERRPVIRELVARTFDAHRAVANLWAVMGDAFVANGVAPGFSRVLYDDDVELRVEFVARHTTSDRQTAAQATSVELQTGQTSDVELEMARSGGTREEAAAAVARRQQASPPAAPEPAPPTVP